MRFFFGNSNPRTKWHPWFAWYPVEVAEGDYRWLEYVERKLDEVYGYDVYYLDYVYREIIK